MVLKCAFTALSVSLLALCCGSSAADTITVNTTQDPPGAVCTQGQCSLRAAIVQANQQPGSDTIILGKGSYRIMISGLLEDQAASGDLDITQNLVIRGAGRSQTIIDGNQLDRIFDIKNAASVEILGVTIKNGFTHDVSNGVIEWGSGVMMGGGIAVSENSSLKLSDCQVSSNRTLTYGGGISSNNGDVVINNCIIDNNTAATGGGIAMHGSGSATILNSTVNSNTAGYGAGFYTLVPSAINTISGSVFYDNRADGGSAIGSLATGSVLYLSNSTISGNTSSIHDAVHMFYGTSIYINNTTIANNKGETSAGLGSLGKVFISNSIIAGNSNSSGVALDCSGSVVNSWGHNIIGSSNGCDFLVAAGDQLGAQFAPMLAPLADNGGLTLTHALFPGSAAIDMASPSLAGSGGGACEELDQRGISRATGGRCDIGAYEAPASADIWVTMTLPANVPADSVTDTASDTDVLTLVTQIGNNGPSNSSSLQLQITLPVGAENQAIVGDAWDCLALANVITCKQQLLASAEQSALEVNFWPPNGVNPMAIIASVDSATADPVVANNTAELIIDNETDKVVAAETSDPGDYAVFDDYEPGPDVVANTSSETISSNPSRQQGADTNAGNWPGDWEAVSLVLLKIYGEEVAASSQLNQDVINAARFEKSWLTMNKIQAEVNSTEVDMIQLGGGMILFAGAVTLYMSPVSLFGIFFSFPLWTLFDPAPVAVLSLRQRKRYDSSAIKQRQIEDASSSIGRILDDKTNRS